MNNQSTPKKYKPIPLKSLNKNRYFSNTAENFNRRIQLKTISNFKGFFNKNFDLTKYKKERQNIFLLSHSLEKIIKPHTIRGNGIPNDITQRIKYLKKIFTSQKFQNYYKQRPKHRLTTFESVAEYIIDFRKKSSEQEAAMMAFYFVTHEIKYLRNNQNMTIKHVKYTQKIDKVFEKKRALSIGFTNFFEYFLKKMEIKYKHIEGYCKLIPKDNSRFFPNPNINNLNINNSLNSSSSEMEIENESSYVNHCWNAIYIRGEWYFVDSLLASGGIEELKNPLSQEDTNCADEDFNFNPYYFMTLPQYLIMTHRPNEDLWQFTEKTLTLKQFLNRKFDDYSRFYKGIFQNEIEFLSHSNPLIKITSKDILVIKLRLRNSLLGAELCNNYGVKLYDVKYSYEESSEVFIFEPSFPSSGEFIIRINSRSLTSTDLVYWPMIDYIVKIENKIKFSYFDKYKLKMRNLSRINNIDKELTLPSLNKTANSNFYQPRIITDYMKIFPNKKNKKICYDDEGFQLIEPKTTFLKKGTYVKFKIKMRGVVSVSILDGNKLFNLKKTERNTYEGQKQICSDNVSVCCLRGKNLFTEVYRFKPLVEKSVDSKAFMLKIRKRKINN